MPPECLTVLAPIKPGEVDALRAVLRPIGDDINGTHMPPGGRPHVAFPNSRDIHFARFAILTDPDRGPGRARLLYASVFDGSLEAHVAELAALSTGFEAIWGQRGGLTRGATSFAAFLKAHAHQPAAYYIAFRDETVSSIQAGDRRSRSGRCGARCRQADAGSFVPGLLRERAAALERIVRAAPIVVDVVVAFARYGFTDVYRGTLRILASLDRYPLFRFVNRLTGNRAAAAAFAVQQRADRYLRCAGAARADGDEIPVDSLGAPRRLSRGCRLAEPVDAGDGHRPRGPTTACGAVMAAIDSFAKRLAPPGSLIGISTIHFVRWLVIDDGRRLMMVSDYDGSWESYIDEFAEMILSGLDAIWETSLALSAGRRAGSARLQAVPPQPPGTGRSVLQRLSERNRSQHRQRHTRAIARVAWTDGRGRRRLTAASLPTMRGATSRGSSRPATAI